MKPGKILPFKNTIQASPQLMIIYNAEALSQEEAVLEVMNKLKAAAWFQVHACLPWMDEVSLKRAMSNLQERGSLVLDKDKSKMLTGPKGKPCHIYLLIKKIA